VDALALRGDEGRGTLRKGSGNREQVLIRTYPNGATQYQSSEVSGRWSEGDRPLASGG